MLQATRTCCLQVVPRQLNATAKTVQTLSLTACMSEQLHLSCEPSAFLLLVSGQLRRWGGTLSSGEVHLFQEAQAPCLTRLAVTAVGIQHISQIGSSVDVCTSYACHTACIYRVMSKAAHSSTYMTRSSEEVMHPSGWAPFPTSSLTCKNITQTVHDSISLTPIQQYW